MLVLSRYYWSNHCLLPRLPQPFPPHLRQLVCTAVSPSMRISAAQTAQILLQAIARLSHALEAHQRQHLRNYCESFARWRSVAGCTSTCFLSNMKTFHATYIFFCFFTLSQVFSIFVSAGACCWVADFMMSPSSILTMNLRS
jgi:hypothetical protein